MNRSFRSASHAIFTLGLAIVSCGASATVWKVGPRDSLQDALNRAQPGDNIQLTAGAAYMGVFTLPAKAGANYITVQSSAIGQFAAGERIHPKQAVHMPKLVSPGRNEPAVRTDPGAHHFRFIGIEFKPATPVAVVDTLIKLGDGSSSQRRPDQVPHDLILDRCYIHGWPGNEMKRGIGLNSASTQILNCYISDCKGIGYDTQAICGWNGPGPFTITNNYLEAAGENIMFGGADPAIPNLVPSDIVISGNHFFKPLSWRVGDPSYAGIHWTVKNLFELKNSQRVTIDGNLFENCWKHAQTGFAISIKASSGGAAPWTLCKDVAFTNNIVRHSASGVNIWGNDANPSSKVNGLTIRNNLFEDINGPAWNGGDGIFIQIGDCNNVTIDHNTGFQTGNLVVAHGVPVTGFAFTNNIAPHNIYGVRGDGTAPGNATLAYWFPGCTFVKNVIEGAGTLAGSYPSRNFFPSSWNTVAFVDLVGGKYALSSASPYKRAATDGSDIGYRSLPLTAIQLRSRDANTANVKAKDANPSTTQ